MPNQIIPTYPFDPTAQAATNKITSEQQVITATNFKDYHMVVPRWAPFYGGGSMVVKHKDLQGVTRTLVMGRDYYLSHYFYSASFNSAKPWYGSIYLVNRQLAGTIILDYQTIGGIWTVDLPTITEILADKLNNPLVTTWEQVVELPEMFPPIDHDWEMRDAVGLSALVQSIVGVEDALRLTGSGALDSHLIDYENPHRTNATHVGLGNVQNWGVATNAQAIQGTSTNTYMTPALTKAAITAQVGNALNLHINNKDNPHNVTAAQLGVYTKAEIDQIIQDVINTGLVSNDTRRFNGMTADEFKAWVLEGTAANSLKFNGYTWQEAFDLIRTDIPAANITGIYTKAEVDALLLQKLGKTEKAADSAKFNGKTYQQAYDDFRSNIPVGNIIGVYSSAEVDTLLIGKLDAMGTAVNSAKFDGRDKDQYKAWVLEGKAADSVRFDGQTKAEFMAQLTQMFGGGEGQENVSRLVYPATTTTGDTWSLIGEINKGVANEYMGQLALMLVGAGTVGQPVEMVSSVTVESVPGSTPAYKVSGQILHGAAGTGVRLGIVSKTRTVGGQSIPYAEVWLRTTKDPNDIAAVLLSPGNGGLPVTPSQVTTEPGGITYVDFVAQGGGANIEVRTGQITGNATSTFPMGFDKIVKVLISETAAGPYFDGVATISVSQTETETKIVNNNPTGVYYRVSFIS